MVLPILIMKLEIGVIFLLIPHNFFIMGKLFFIEEIMRASVTGTFINSKLFAFLPFEKGIRTIGTKVF